MTRNIFMYDVNYATNSIIQKGFRKLNQALS